MPPKPTQVRCAVYTRKSTEEGLEKAFNSLDAQREVGEAYVKSQAGEGWVLVPAKYDDGGFTGGNIDRPELTRSLRDVEAGLFISGGSCHIPGGRLFRTRAVSLSVYGLGRPNSLVRNQRARIEYTANCRM